MVEGRKVASNRDGGWGKKKGKDGDWEEVG